MEVAQLDGRAMTALQDDTGHALRTLDRCIHELENAFEGCAPALDHGHHPPHRAQRRQEDCQQSGEGRQLTHGQGAPQHHRAADGDQGEHGDAA